MRPCRSRRGFAVFSSLGFGLAWLFSATSAHAQFSYGYDSLTYGPQSQAAYADMGYTTVYTDPSTGTYFNGAQAPFRGVAPYSEPPFGTMGRVNGLSPYVRQAPVVMRQAPVTRQAPARPVAVPRRRGLFGRVRARP